MSLFQQDVQNIGLNTCFFFAWTIRNTATISLRNEMMDVSKTKQMKKAKTCPTSPPDMSLIFHVIKMLDLNFFFTENKSYFVVHKKKFFC